MPYFVTLDANPPETDLRSLDRCPLLLRFFVDVGT